MRPGFLAILLCACGGETASDLPESPGSFSFFVTSIEAMRRLSGSQNGFGGDLRYGEATGLAGADKICTEIAESEVAGSGAKGWRAFLSTSSENAMERVGDGPWYDRLGRPVAANVDDLVQTRPVASTDIINDLPNERGESQQNQDGDPDNHDVLTGSDASGTFVSGATCGDWTSLDSGRPVIGHSWPANSGRGWIKAHSASGCGAVVSLVETGPGVPGCSGVGCGGGYGAIYCFALEP